MKPFLVQLKSEMKLSIDERTVSRLLKTMKEQEDSDAEVFDFEHPPSLKIIEVIIITHGLQMKLFVIGCQYSHDFMIQCCVRSS